MGKITRGVVDLVRDRDFVLEMGKRFLWDREASEVLYDYLSDMDEIVFMDARAFNLEFEYTTESEIESEGKKFMQQVEDNLIETFRIGGETAYLFRSNLK